jgi:plasmid stability protein
MNTTISTTALNQRYPDQVATIQIRDIPEDAYERIRLRARAAGQSIQAYMRDQVIVIASRPTKAEVFADIEAALADHGTSVTMESILEHRDADRR